METALSTLSRWTTDCGLGVKPEKTELLFTWKYKIPSRILPKLHQTRLTLSNQEKYLGVILESHFLSPILVHWLYTAIVRPILLYGNIVWWHSLEKNYNLRILHKIQGSAEICISGALCTSATEALNTILDLQPLDLLAKSWASATALRLREAAAWTTGSTGHSSILTSHISIPHITDYVPPIVNFERRYKIFIHTGTYWDNLPHQFKNAVNIYTEKKTSQDQFNMRMVNLCFIDTYQFYH